MVPALQLRYLSVVAGVGSLSRKLCLPRNFFNVLCLDDNTVDARTEVHQGESKMRQPTLDGLVATSSLRLAVAKRPAPTYHVDSRPSYLR